MFRLLCSRLALILLVPMLQCVPCNADVITQVLTNGGFETGDLTGWTETVGGGFVVSSANGAGFDPNTPRNGSFMFSSSTISGAVPDQTEITLSQVIDVSAIDGIATGLATFSAQGFFAGGTAVPIGGGTSDDTAQITVELFDGTVSLGSFSTPVIDPILGFWNPLQLTSTPIPASTDTIAFSMVTRLDTIPGVRSIDILADDLSLTITSVPEPSSFLALVVPMAFAVLRRRRPI